MPNTVNDEVYERLQEKMLRYADYADLPVEEAEEAVLFEALRAQGVLAVEHLDEQMRAVTGDTVYVRRPLVDLLYWAGQELKTLDRSLTLRIVYGFRALEIQTSLFEDAKALAAQQYPDEADQIEAAHRRFAVPVVAGRPTGGAVGVDILRDGAVADLGTPVMSSSKDSFTFSPFVSRDAWELRQLLRRAMMAAGFAPYDGEWWHFSYGDKEWARYYRRPGALYDQIALAQAQKVDPDDRLRL
jgi:D-alanyl-D-alanine dipeptidase